MRDVYKTSQLSDRIDFFSIPYPGFVNRSFQQLNGLIIDLSIHWVGVAILPAMSKTESGWVFETGFDPVNQL